MLSHYGFHHDGCHITCSGDRGPSHCGRYEGHKCPGFTGVVPGHDHGHSSRRSCVSRTICQDTPALHCVRHVVRSPGRLNSDSHSACFGIPQVSKWLSPDAAHSSLSNGISPIGRGWRELSIWVRARNLHTCPAQTRRNFNSCYVVNYSRQILSRCHHEPSLGWHPESPDG